MTVETDTALRDRYMDLTTQAEALSDFITKTIKEELVNELDFLAGYNKTKKGNTGHYRHA